MVGQEDMKMMKSEISGRRTVGVYTVEKHYSKYIRKL